MEKEQEWYPYSKNITKYNEFGEYIGSTPEKSIRYRDIPIRWYKKK
ncbi:hypothetical protein KRX57_04715 [Weeksellaceae bacterium TAE3-ERU29]|nr:hypothetical protein [Weeksellaceae bacterium TAE3-ERU29]